MLILGAHLSASKGYVHMLREAQSIGANTFQFFTRNPRGGAVKAQDPADVAAFLQGAQAADFDPVELYKARQVIRPAQEKAAEQQLEDAMHEKPSLIMLLSAKQETSHLLGADAEERQARQLIMHRNQEQYRNSLSKRKRNDPER